MSKINFIKWILFFVLILNVNKMNAQHNADSMDAQQQSLVIISALSATGNLENLKAQLHRRQIRLHRSKILRFNSLSRTTMSQAVLWRHGLSAFQTCVSSERMTWSLCTITTRPQIG